MNFFSQYCRFKMWEKRWTKLLQKIRTNCNYRTRCVRFPLAHVNQIHQKSRNFRHTIHAQFQVRTKNQSEIPDGSAELFHYIEGFKSEAEPTLTSFKDTQTESIVQCYNYVFQWNQQWICVDCTVQYRDEVIRRISTQSGTLWETERRRPYFKRWIT